MRAVPEKTHRSPPASGLLLSQRSRLCWSIAMGQVKKQDGGPLLCEKFSLETQDSKEKLTCHCL